MKTLKALFGIICLIAAFNAQTAHAQVVYPDRTAFNSAFPGATVENWSEFANNTVIDNGNTLNGITYQTNGYNVRVSKNLLSASFPDGIGSNTIGDLGQFTSKDEITFDFSQPLTAFGIDINSTALRGGAFEAVLSNGQTIDSTKDPITGDPLEQFIGFSDTSSSFDSITIEDLTKNPYKIDSLQYVDAAPTVGQSVVPEPSTVALMIIGLMGIAVFALRRKLVFVNQ